MTRKTAAQLRREIEASLGAPRPLASASGIRRLQEEVDRHTREVAAARNRLDAASPPTPERVLRRVDTLLSMAQDQLGRHLLSQEVRDRDPAAYRSGDEIFDEVEKIRRRILRRPRG